MIRAYWLRLLGFALAGALLAFGLSWMAPKKYEGFVQILIDQKQQDPTVTTDPAYDAVRDLSSFTRSRSIVTQVEQLTGYDVLRRAGEAAARETSAPIEKAGEFAAISLRSNLSVEAEQGSDIITLRVRMSQPDYAQAVAGQIYTAFEDQNNENARVFAERAMTYLESKAKDVQKELKAVDDQAAEIRQRHSAPDLTAKIQSEINGLAILTQGRDAAAIELEGATQRLASLQGQLDVTPKTIEASTSQTQNPVMSGLEQALVEARAERAQLLEHNLPDSDRVKAVNGRIRQLETDLKSTKERMQGPSTTTQNPNYQNLLQAVTEAKGAVASLRARVTQAEAEIVRSETQLQALPAAQSELAALLRRQSVLEQIYQTYGRQLESLRLAQQGRLAPTRLVTPASVLPMPVSPKIPINVVMGLLFGALIGVLSMFAAEAKRQPIRTIHQLNSLSLEPVYRLIPELRQPFRGLDRSPHEAFETLLVGALKSTKRPYRLGVVGLTKDSGASTAALNLAVAAERHGLKVLIISNDPKSSIRRYLWRSGNVPQGDSVEVSANITWISGDAGKIVAGGSGERLSDAAGTAERDLTIFDFEPSTESAEYTFVAPYLNEMIVLARANKARTVEFITTQQALKDAGCRQVTVAFSRAGAMEVATDEVAQSTASRPAA